MKAFFAPRTTTGIPSSRRASLSPERESGERAGGGTPNYAEVKRPLRKVEGV